MYSYGINLVKRLIAASKSRRWALLVTVAGALLLITLDNSVLYTALPTLTRALQASTTQALWIVNAYPLVMAGLLLGAGTLGDRIGHRRMFMGGLCIFGVASLMAAFAPSAAMLIGARALLAVGAAAMMPSTLALISITFRDERERNLAIAIWGCMAIVGSAAGPIVGGLLLNHFWWGSAFLLNVPVVIVAFISALIVTPRIKPDASKHWDLISSLQVLFALSGLVVTIKEVAHPTPSWPLTAVALLVTVLAGALFARRQTHLTYPLLDFSIFRNPAFLAGVLACAFSLFAIAGLQLVVTQRYQLVAGYSPLQAGLLVSAVALGALPSGVLGGAFVHRTGLLPLIGGGLGLGTAGVLLVCFGFHAGLGLVATGLAVTGLGLGSVMSVASSAVVGNVSYQRAGMASSVGEVSYEFGSLLAVALLGSLLAALYSSGINLPAGVSDNARDSMIKALAMAAQNATVGPALIAAASTAFDRSFLIVMHVIAAVLSIGTLVTSVLLRRHGPGSSAFRGGSH
jgi:DHA2 family multidrug resistance protein-like MFS transporter